LALTTAERLWQSAEVPRWLPILVTFASFAGCDTVDLGDNFVPPDIQLDEDFFYCRVQPEVIAAQSCASGLAGEGGACHSSQSGLRLDPAGETDLVPCTGDVVDSPVPTSYQDNLEAVRAFVYSDALSSPLYLRPVGMDTHPRIIFDASSPEAMLIIEWISGGGP